VADRSRMCAAIIVAGLVITFFLSVVGIYTIVTTTAPHGFREWVAYSFLPLAVLLVSSFMLCSKPWAVTVISMEVLVAAGVLLVALLNHGLPHIAVPWTWTHFVLAVVFIVGNVLWGLHGKTG
jgi:hypothetical protein